MRARSLTLPLILAYIFCVIASQALLIAWLGGGLHLPEPLAISTDAGNISIELMEVTIIEFTVDTLNFNQGYINESCNNCTMDTEGSGNADTSCCHHNWATPPADGLLLENKGNTVVSLYISTSANASSWINGTNVTPSFQFKMLSEATEAHASSDGDDTAESCLSTWKPADWAEATTVNQYICGNETQYDYHFANNRDEAHLIVKAVIPRDATRGNKAVTFQVTATAP